MYQSIAKKPVLTLTVIAAALVEGCRAIGLDGNYASAGGHLHGVSDTKAYVGDLLAVDVLGTSTCEAGAPIAADALLEVGTDGKFITKTTGKTVGRALSAASGDGVKFHALLIPANT